ncbi:MAG TPA: hypothetical protein ENI96_04590 [Sedimenticola thiotaurini]|uniref:DUF995 domain-containing protein n=1 Tax=Sedimenticola thiotaurini TaxID=1543721 RepID=A0A831RJB4_9GAMM|nr:hypothetical protein [Sedimenticola thiotaurini]
MNKPMVFALAFATLSGTAVTSSAASMSGSEIGRVFAGNTIEWVSLKKKPMSPRWKPPYGRTYFSPNGTMEGTLKGKSRSGTWRIDGNQLCLNWKQEKCRDLEPDGGGGYYIVNREKGKRGVHIKRVLQGKQL